MSQTTKPLILLNPLSPTLEKLKEVIEEISESEGIEVFEVDSIEECSQLIPTIGQALILVASPKKCAMMLQANRKAIKKLQTKTILLSPKNIPRKTLDKFMKVGLTECVVEPVNPKTLLYKVKLQLRSIVSKAEQEEINNRTNENSHMKEEEDQKAQVRMEKGVIEEDAPEVEKKEKKTYEEQVLENPLKREKKAYKEEAIDGYYKGKKKTEDSPAFEEEPEKKKKKYVEEEIEGHLKGKVKDKEIEMEGNIVSKRKPQEVEIQQEFEPLEKPKIEIELEEDLARMINREAEAEVQAEDKKKTMVDLQVDEDKASREKSDQKPEDLGGHYKGKIQKAINIEEDDDYLDEKEEEFSEEAIREKAKKAALAIEDDEEEKDYVNEQIEEDFSPLKGKSNSIQIEDDHEKDFVDKKEEAFVEEEAEKEKVKLEVALDREKDPLKKEEEVINQEERKKRDAKADQIDGYLRGGAAKKTEIEVDDEDLYHDAAKEAEILEKKEKKASIEIEDDEKDPLLGEKEYEDDFGSDKKKQEKLLLEEDDDLSGKRNAKNKKEDEEGYRKSNYKEDEKGGFTKGKGNGKLDEVKDNNNRANARADRIKTHYSSKESLKHGEQEWDAKWEKSEKEEMEFESQKREEKELIINKEDLGEQTIDYGQLKKEFEGISIDGVRNKKKEYGTFDNVAEIKTYRKKVMSVEGTSEEMEFEEVDEQLVEQESHQVFEPNSLGMEIAIQVQNYYYEKEVNPLKLCQFINKKVNETFSGTTVFYSFANDALKGPFFNGYVANKIGVEPESPSPSELDELTRLERREIEKEYQEESKRYKADLEQATEEWNNKYGQQLVSWKEYKTPSWKDHTFQQEENEFIFPFYEGATLMGLCVFIPGSEFKPLSAESIEAVFEVARGVIISEYHKAKGEGQISGLQKKNETQPEEKKGGLFGRLFGKAG